MNHVPCDEPSPILRTPGLWTPPKHRVWTPPKRRVREPLYAVNAYVQSRLGGSTVATNNIARAYSSNNSAGNTLPAFVIWSSASPVAITKVTDSVGNGGSSGWVNSPAGTISVGTVQMAAFYFIHCAASPSGNTVTATFASNVANCVIMIAEYSGPNNFDHYGTATTASALNLTVNSTAALASGELAVAGLGTLPFGPANSTGLASGSGANWTSRIAHLDGAGLADGTATTSTAVDITWDAEETCGCCETAVASLGITLLFNTIASSSTNALFYNTD